MKHASDWWATEAELVVITQVPAGVLRPGREAALFDGLVQEVDGEVRYSSDVAPLVAWSDKLGFYDVVAAVSLPSKPETSVAPRSPATASHRPRSSIRR